MKDQDQLQGRPSALRAGGLAHRYVFYIRAARSATAPLVSGRQAAACGGARKRRQPSPLERAALQRGCGFALDASHGVDIHTLCHRLLTRGASARRMSAYDGWGARGGAPASQGKGGYWERDSVLQRNVEMVRSKLHGGGAQRHAPPPHTPLPLPPLRALSERLTAGAAQRAARLGQRRGRRAGGARGRGRRGAAPP